MTGDRSETRKKTRPGMGQIAAALVAAALCLALYRPAFAAGPRPRTPGQAAVQPINLSHSGTATNPRIVALADGKIQVFWLDRFDGLMAAVYDGETWSEPRKAKIPDRNLTGMPEFYLDSSGWIDAFWLEPEEDEAAGYILKHSLAAFGATDWYPAQVVARYVLGFDVSATNTGLMAAYIQGQAHGNEPAGVYVRQKYGGDASFLAPRMVYADNYYRALTTGQAYIQVKPSQATPDNIFLAWVEPQTGNALLSASADRGKTWSEAREARPSAPPAPGAAFTPLRLLALDDPHGADLLWLTRGEDNCVIYQQGAAADPSGIRLGAQDKARQLPGACPQNDRLWSREDGSFWVWGEGTAQLTVMRWMGQAGQWSIPADLRYTAQDPDTQKSDALEGLHASLIGDQLRVVGSGVDVHDIWFISAPIDSLATTVQEKSAWREPGRIEVGDGDAGGLALALDSAGQIHAVWTQLKGLAGSGAAIFYAQVVDHKASRTVKIFNAETGNSNPHPSLLIEPQPENEGDILHLAWCGGQNEGILYSRALAKEALSPAAWTSPVRISVDAPAVWPQLARGPDHSLYVLYAVQLNEKRGVYVAHSPDGGKSWAEPVQVFDAARAGWQMVDHPAFSISADGVLHAAWVQKPLPFMGAPSGIYYARSLDGGQTWSAALPVADDGYDWPALGSTRDRVHLIYLQPGTGALFQRFFSLDETPDRSLPHWSVAFNLLDYLAIAQPGSQDRPFNIAVSQSRVYLTGGLPGARDLFMSTWTGSQSETAQWSSAEEIAAPEAGDVQVISKVQGGMTTQARSGLVAVAYLEQARPQSEAAGSAKTSLVINARSVPAEDALAIKAWQPVQPTKTSIPSPGQALLAQAAASTAKTPAASGTAKPSFNEAAQSQGLTVLPPVLGILLAAVVIVLIFVFRSLWLRQPG